MVRSLFNAVVLDKGLRLVHGLVFPFVVVSIIGVAEYGEIVFLLSVVGFFSVFIHLGMSRPFFVSLNSDVKAKSEELSSVICKFLSLKIVSFALLSAMMALLYKFYDYNYVALSFLMIGLFLKLYMGIDSFMQAIGKVRDFYKLSAAALMVALPLKVILLWFYHESDYVLFVFLVEDLIILLGSVVFLKKLFLFRKENVVLLFVQSISFLYKNFFSFCNSLLSSFQAHGDRLIVGLVAGNELLAIYNFARMPLNASKSLSSALYTDNAVEIKKARELSCWSVIGSYFKNSFMIMLVLSAVSFFIYPYVLIGFNEDISVSYLMMVGICLQIMLLPLWSFFNDISLSYGEYKNYFLANFIGYCFSPIYIFGLIELGFSNSDSIVLGFSLSVLTHFVIVVFVGGCQKSSVVFKRSFISMVPGK